MKKLLISFVLVFTMLLSIGMVAFAYDATVTDETGFTDALGNTDSEITITLAGDIDAGWLEIPEGKKVTIKGEGTLNCEGVDVCGTLLLGANVNIVSEEGVAVAGTFNMSGGSVTVIDDVYAVDIASGASFVLSGGTVSGGSIATVRVNTSGVGGSSGGNASFEMSGGNVTNATTGVESKGNLEISGGSVSGGKTGVQVGANSNATTEISGGSVSGGETGVQVGSNNLGETKITGTSSISGNTTGLEIGSLSVVTMSGGAVKSSNGDSVVNNGGFTMSGGSVEATNGNGVVNNGYFTMEGGSVEAAKVGVSNEGNGNFTMTDGFVKGDEVSVKDNGANQSQLNGGTVYVYTPPVANPYNVPSTADNSNMPLWSVLFIAFAAIAIISGKKRRA